MNRYNEIAQVGNPVKIYVYIRKYILILLRHFGKKVFGSIDIEEASIAVLNKRYKNGFTLKILLVT